eukprot:scaffold4843_cov266-Chaetoceros_neogracile.AAC.3
MKGAKTQSNRPMYRGTTFKDGDIPKSINRKKKRPSKPQQNKYADADNAKEKSHPDQLQKVESTPIEKVEEQEKGSSFTEEEEALIQEIKQVRRKIRTLQESIQLSINISQPSVWRDNCLNATVNIVNQWRSIVLFYGIQREDICSDDGNLEAEDMNLERKNESDDDKEIEATSTGRRLNQNVCTERVHIAACEEKVIVASANDSTMRDKDSPLNEWSRTTGLQVYGLIQMALQTGPLKGSNAGYFKRCGAQIANMARSFLVQCITSREKSNVDNDYFSDNNEGVPDCNPMDASNVLNELLFTLKQKDAIEKWIKDAGKAVSADKAPTKSALKLQASINTKGMSRKDKRKKGSLVNR